MDGNHPERIDSRPKRRKDQSNPYKLFTVGIDTEEPHYYVSFPDSQGVQICLEINKELFDTMDQFELNDLSALNERDNHFEQSELTEESLNKRAVVQQEPLDELVFEKMQHQKLYKAISQLPELQRRRLVLYYFGGYTYEQIARMEGCSKVAVKYTVDRAIDSLKNYYKNFEKQT